METRNRAEVSLAAGDDSNPRTVEPSRRATERPGSAPVTREEGSAARLTAGSAANVVAAKRRDATRFAKPRIVEQIERELNEMRQEAAKGDESSNATDDLHFGGLVT